MLKQLYYQFILEPRNDVGRIAAFLKLKKRKSRKRSVPGSTAAYTVPLYILKLLWTFVLKFAYIFVFIFLPCSLFSALRGREGFPFLESMVYFTVLLSCICGSLINSGMFDMDDDAYIMLTTMRMEPEAFFQGRILYKLLVDGICFLLSYVILGMDFPHAFYLVVWVLISRVIGEAVNLYVFRFTGKIVNEIPGIPVIIMAVAVLGAYGFPYLRNHVVNLTDYAYDYLWLLAALVVCAVVLYGLFNYGGYSYIARHFVKRMKEQLGEAREERKEELELLAGDMVTEKYFKAYDKDGAKGIAYIHKIFFARSREYIKNALFLRIVILVLVTIAGVVICRLSGENARETVWNVLRGCLPLMVFVLFCLSVAPTVCKSLFYHIDSRMLHDRHYRRGISNFRSFMIRLRRIWGMDLLLSLLLCAAIGLVGCAAGHGSELDELVPVYLGILMLSGFFTVFYLTVYYMCQPYNRDMKIKNYTYLLANGVMLLIAYGCVYINVNAVVFDIAAGILLAVSLSAASTLVYYVSERTFKLCR